MASISIIPPATSIIDYYFLNSLKQGSTFHLHNQKIARQHVIQKWGNDSLDPKLAFSVKYCIYLKEFKSRFSSRDLLNRERIDALQFCLEICVAKQTSFRDLLSEIQVFICLK